MKEYFKKLVDTTDPSSTMRWVTIFVIVFTSLVFWGTWLVICLIKNAMVDMPTGAVTAYSSSNLTAVGGKLLQKIFGEKDKEITTPAKEE